MSRRPLRSHWVPGDRADDAGLRRAGPARARADGEPLALLLDDPNQDVRAGAATALSHLDKPSDLTIVTLKRTAIREKNARVAASMPNTIWSHSRDFSESEAIVDQLLTSESGAAVEVGCDLVAQIGTAASTVSPQLDLVLYSRDLDSLWAACNAIEAIGSPACWSIPKLVRLLGEGTDRVAGAASAALASIGMSSFPELVACSSASDSKKQRYARQALSRMSRGNMRSLVSAWRKEDNSGHRCSIAVALAEIERTSVVLPELIHQLRLESNLYLRMRIARAFGTLGKQAQPVVAELKQIIHTDMDSRIVSAAKQSIKEILR